MSAENMLTVDEARELILDSISLLEPKPVDLLEACGRVLWEDVAADGDVPPFDNSAMDGYAVLSRDLEAAGPQSPVKLRVVADIPAGRAGAASLQPGEAARIMTGAPIPPVADAVVPVELTEPKNGWVLVKTRVRPGRDIRRAGEDVRAGEVVLRIGTPVRPAEIAMLATLGRKRVQVVRRPRVAVLTTGDELVDVDEPLAPGKIRNSNLYSLMAQIRSAGAEAISLGVARDLEEDLLAKMGRGQEADVLVTSAGVSVGDYDMVKGTLERLGEVSFWRVRMRPGKPIVFGRIGKTPMFGLPGNPVSSMVAFELFVRPALLKMQGHSRLRKPVIQAICEERVDNHDGRRAYIRAITRQEEGQYRAKTTGSQGSHIIRSMCLANSLLVVPEDVVRIEPGDLVTVQMLDWPEVE